jgi:hypothetical protein
MKDTFLTKSIDQSTSTIYDRNEIVSAPLWSTGKSELTSIYTSSNQPHHQRIYYRNIYSNNINTESLDVEFSIAYGNTFGSGSSTGSYGLIDYIAMVSDTSSLVVSESRVVYNQYRNLLTDYDRRENLSSGSFKFYGLPNTSIGPYVWGSKNIYTQDFISIPTRVGIPNTTSYRLRSVKSISVRSTGEFANIFFINNEGKLFEQYVNAVQIGTSTNWKQVSAGYKHTLAVKEDGTLWSWGDNDWGQLGLGYESLQIVQNPVQVGGDTDWAFVCAGYSISFAIKTDGTLWGWGMNTVGLLGFNDTRTRSEPEQLIMGRPPLAETWKKISISKIDNPEKQTIVGIHSTDNLYGWGDNSNIQISLILSPYDIQTTPHPMDAGTWIDVSVGSEFVMSVSSSGELVGRGSTGFYGYTGLGNPNPLVHGPVKVGTDKDWLKVECGYGHSLAIKNNFTLWGWGRNTYYEQGRSNNLNNNPPNPPRQIGTKTGWTKLAASIYNSAAIIDIVDTNKSSTRSEDIYVLNINRSNFKDKIDAGSWQLSLSAVDRDMNPDTTKIIQLVDESVDYKGTNEQSPMYQIPSRGGIVYTIYSGSLTNGIHQSANTDPYGLFYPESGIILLNGEMLMRSASIETRRMPATASGAWHLSSNADMLYTSISGAMSVGHPFIAKTVEIKMPSYYFIRINNDEFNYTTNPSYYRDRNRFLRKEHIMKSPYEFTYITTIGLYNNNGDLLAVAKLSKPIKKTPLTELVIKVKLDI